jgi:predicted MFS family arabinose efflux permease
MKSSTMADRSISPSTESTMRWTEIGMFIILLASYAINAMDRQIFPLIAADVRKEFGFGLADTGLLSTIFTLGMAVAGVPTGYLVARYSRKTVLQIGIAIFSLGTLATAYAVGFADMLVYRAITGIGEAMQLTVLIAVGASYFVRYRSTAVGSINFSFGIGAIIGPVLGGLLLGAERDWRLPLITFGIMGFVAMAIIAALVSKRLTETQAAVDNNRADLNGAPTLVNRNTIILTILSIFGGLVIYGYLGMYPTFLREQLHYTPAATGGVMSFFGFGVFASIFGGWLGDRFSPRLVLGASFIGAAILGYLLFSGPTGAAAQSALSFTWGFVVSGILYVNLAGYQIKAVRTSLASRATGIFVTALYGAGALAGYILGGIAAHAGWSTAGLTQITLVSVVGAVLALTLQPEQMALVTVRGKR